MSILQKLLGPFAPEQSKQTQPLDRRAIGWSANLPNWQINKPQWPQTNYDTYQNAYKNVVTVYACVHARAKAVSSATLRVYQEVDGDPKEIPDHALRTLMQQPNPMMSEAEFLVLTQTMMDVFGFAAIEKQRFKVGGGVAALWHLQPQWLKPIYRSNAAPDWEYTVPGNPPQTIKSADIITITSAPSLGVSDAFGLSPLSAALREVGIEDAATNFAKLFLDHGGMPMFALSTDQPIRDQAVVDLIKERWMQSYGGWSNWINVALLSDGLKPEKLSLNIDEMAYPELRNLTEARICSAFGVPPIIIGANVGLEQATYSNYEQARKAFYEDTVVDLWARLDGALTRGLLAEFDPSGALSIQFDTSSVPALREDINAAWTNAGDALSRGGITLNQFQAAVGLPGFGPAGDVLYLPMAAQPIRPDDLVALADEATAPPAPAALPAGSDTTGDTTAGDVTGNLKNPSGTGDTTDATKALPAGVEYRSLPLERRAGIAIQNRRLVNRLAARHAPKLIRYFQQQGNRVIAAVTGERADADFDVRAAMQTIDWDEEERLLSELMTDLYHKGGKTAYDAVNEQLNLRVGVDWDMAHPLIRQTQRYLASRVVAINLQTRKEIGRVVTDAIEQGTSMPDLRDRLYGLYNETYRNRSMTIARTESQVAFNLSNKDAYKQSGVVRGATLFDNPNHDTDPSPVDGLTCADRNGLDVELDDVQVHVFAEHPNGTLAVAPLLYRADAVNDEGDA